MKRIGQQEKTIAGIPGGRQHRSCPSAHRSTTNQEDRRTDLATDPLDHGRETRLETGHRIWPAASTLAIEEVEAHDAQADTAQGLGDLEHAAVREVAAGPVGTDEERPCQRCGGGLEDSRRLLVSHLPFPST